jgi:hypothetical protein
MPAAAALVLALAALLASCVGELPLAYAPPGNPPVDYRQTAADAALLQLKKISLSGAQISELREAKAPQLGDFVACLHTVPITPQQREAEFAVQFESGHVIGIRRAVAIDHCDSGIYSPLPKPKVSKAAPDAPDASVVPEAPVQTPDADPNN